MKTKEEIENLRHKYTARLTNLFLEANNTTAIKIGMKIGIQIIDEICLIELKDEELKE